MQFSVYGLKEPLNITRCKAFQRCQWGFRSCRIWCCEIGNCLPKFRDSIVNSSTTEDKPLNVVFSFMWTNIMLKVHSCICKCSFVWIIYPPNIAFISNSWYLSRFWTTDCFLKICLSRGQCRLTHPKPKSNNNCPLLVLPIQVVSTPYLEAFRKLENRSSVLSWQSLHVHPAYCLCCNGEN